MGLSHTLELLEKCGNPHKYYKSIHVAGTNGKGSTCSMVAEILIKAGYKVGVYSSPHLIRFNERIRINNTFITDEDITLFIKNYKNDIERIESTFFETTTAMAFKHFAENNIDVAVIETGLGGRLDATNVISPAITAITPISLDHREILGSDIETITKEKGGIIKPGIPVVLAKQEKASFSILQKISRKKNSKIVCQENPQEIKINENGTTFKIKNKFFKIPLIGEHQAFNSALSIAIINQFDSKINNKIIQKGLDETTWPARLQRMLIEPPIFYDVAHNVKGIDVMLDSITSLYNCLPVGLITLKSDKEIDIIAKATFRKFKPLIISGNKDKGLLEGKELAKSFKISNHIIQNSFVKGLDDLVKISSEVNRPGVIFGSHYIAKEVFDKFGFLI
ncbi:MAG: bifunctional folylpolyglutamate synthase/dihydrofolate synthase [Candidatus Neomarinimicrobiota bacterium]